MSIISIATDFAGQVGVNPRRVCIVSTDNLSAVTTLNYLKSAANMGYPIMPTDQIFMSYSGGSGIFKPTISGSNITLTAIATA